jgi:Zn-dependent peptidase ImmA (M78 family)
MKTDIQLNAEAIRLRKRLGQDASSPVDIFRLILSDENLTLIFLPMGDRISGISIRLDNSMLLGINSTLSHGRQRFTAAHELFHLFYDEHFGMRICAKNKVSKDETENEADRFASYFLAPYEALQEFIRDRLKKERSPLMVEDVIRIEQHFGLSRHATLVRLQREGYLTEKEAKKMQTGIVALARRLGYDTALYLPTPEEKQYATFGKYVALAKRLREEELVSHGKYEELLLDGFRYDIVYGINLDEERYD